MADLVISTEFRDGLVAYLGDKPYKEVAQPIAMLLALAPPKSAPVLVEPPEAA